MYVDRCVRKQSCSLVLLQLLLSHATTNPCRFKCVQWLTEVNLIIFRADKMTMTLPCQQFQPNTLYLYNKSGVLLQSSHASHTNPGTQKKRWLRRAKHFCLLKRALYFPVFQRGKTTICNVILFFFPPFQGVISILICFGEHFGFKPCYTCMHRGLDFI